jgi:hypothetical protein
MVHDVTYLNTQDWVWAVYSTLTQSEIAEMQVKVLDIIIESIWDDEFEKLQHTDWNILKNQILDKFNKK